MKKAIIISIILNWSAGARGQQILNYLNDTAIKFSILIPSTDLQDGFFYNSTNRYLQTNVPDSIVQQLLKMKNSKWMDLLSNDSTAYATTLLLYQIRAKDATIFEVTETKENWMKSQREKDMEYWRSFLRKNNVSIRMTD